MPTHPVTLTAAEVKRLLAEDRDFIYLPRCGNSLKQALERYPDGAPDSVIARALLIPEPEVEVLYQSAVVRLRQLLGVVTPAANTDTE